jgi:hypothetical protein
MADRTEAVMNVSYENQDGDLVAVYEAGGFRVTDNDFAVADLLDAGRLQSRAMTHKATLERDGKLKITEVKYGNPNKLFGEGVKSATEGFNASQQVKDAAVDGGHAVATIDQTTQENQTVDAEGESVTAPAHEVEKTAPVHVRAGRVKGAEGTPHIDTTTKGGATVKNAAQTARDDD